MPSSNLSGKTKADLVVLAELSGLLSAAEARRKTKADLLVFLAEAENKNSPKSETVQSQADLPVKKEASAGGKDRPGAARKKTAESKDTQNAITAAGAKSTRKKTTAGVRQTADQTAADKSGVKSADSKKASLAAQKSDDTPVAVITPDVDKSQNKEDAKKTSAKKRTATSKKSTQKATGRAADAAKASAANRRRTPGRKKTIADSVEPTADDSASSDKKTLTAPSKADVQSAPADQSKADIQSTPAAQSKADIQSAPADQSKADIQSTPAAQSKTDAQTAPAAESKADVQSVPPAKSKTGIKNTQSANSKPVSASESEKSRNTAKNPRSNRKTRPADKIPNTENQNVSDSASDPQPVSADDSSGTGKDAAGAGKEVSGSASEPRNSERNEQNGRQSTQPRTADNRQRRPVVEQGESVSGTLEIMPDGYGFLRKDNYLQGSKDIYVPPQYIRRFNLKTGDYIAGPGKLQRETDRYQALLYIKEVNGMPPEKMLRRPQFDRLTPIYPDERYRLETARNELSTRIIDLAAPIGKGQRGMIVSPPKAGKTILLQKIANAISINNPEVKLIVLLIDERPEEVTDMQRSIKGEVVYSTFDKTPENHVKVTELVLERAMRLVELKQDVVILLDSMTRLARAYNLTINPTGRTLSGGLDPGALYGPKRFFGAARNIENGGSLTIIATSLIETGSRMDEVIFEEFKGTGNMEVYLDRKLSEKRIFPAIDINRSGTRREELLMSDKELDAVWTIRKAFSQLDTAAVTETIINLLLKTQNNEHFISSINVSFNDKSFFEAMRGTRTGGNNQNSNGSGNGGTR